MMCKSLISSIFLGSSHTLYHEAIAVILRKIVGLEPEGVVTYVEWFRTEEYSQNVILLKTSASFRRSNSNLLRVQGKRRRIHKIYTQPCAFIASATLINPAILAPATRSSPRPYLLAASTEFTKMFFMMRLRFSSTSSALQESRIEF